MPLAGRGCPVPGQRSGQGAEARGPLPAAHVAGMGSGQARPPPAAPGSGCQPALLEPPVSLRGFLKTCRRGRRGFEVYSGQLLRDFCESFLFCPQIYNCRERQSCYREKPTFQ